MKQQLVFIYSIFIAFSLNAQNICIFDVEIKDNHGQPFSNKNIYLYNCKTKISWSFSDKEGKASFLIDSLPFNSDSVYLFIKEENSLNNNIKIFINTLRLLESNETGNYSIKITDFRLFTQEEYIKYCKKNGLMPRRKETLVKDVE